MSVQDSDSGFSVPGLFVQTWVIRNTRIRPSRWDTVNSKPETPINPYTCVYITAYMYTYAYIYVSLWGPLYIYIYIYIYSQPYIYTHIYIYVYVYNCTHFYV